MKKHKPIELPETETRWVYYPVEHPDGNVSIERARMPITQGEEIQRPMDIRVSCENISRIFWEALWGSK